MSYVMQKLSNELMSPAQYGYWSVRWSFDVAKGLVADLVRERREKTGRENRGQTTVCMAFAETVVCPLLRFVPITLCANKSGGLNFKRLNHSKFRFQLNEISPRKQRHFKRIQFEHLKTIIIIK